MKKYNVNSIKKNIQKKDIDLDLVFNKICKNNSILLESAEINTKEKLKSILVIDSSIKIQCIRNRVIFKPLTESGKYILKKIKSNINHNINVLEDDYFLILNFPSQDKNIKEEREKLKQISVFDALRLIKESFIINNEFEIFLAGLFSYDLVSVFEDLPEIQRKNNCSDYVFYLAETILVADYKNDETYLQVNIFSEKETENLKSKIDNLSNQIENISKNSKNLDSDKFRQKDKELTVSIQNQDFCNIVDSLKTNIINGDIFQIVPSRSFYLPCESPNKAYRELKRTNPSPYMFFMKDDDFELFGASPESAIKYTSEINQVEVYPIAGTRKRGKKEDGFIDLDLDSRIELELRLDKKENAEHMMLVDLARNDIARISKPGTRYVADLLKVDRYSHVMHLVSRVVGQLSDDLDALHAYQANMNMGTLTGAPKIKAMELISKVEKQTRGSYGGAIGYFNGYGDFDTCIVIRSAYVENNIAEIQAGAGVVLDSIALAETQETTAKAQAVISAIKNS